MNRTVIGAAVPVAAVAFAAGWQSYTHIESLALTNGQSILDARLLPLAVDGLIAAGSIIVLGGGQLGWLCVALGVAATLFANVMSGMPYGPLAATVAAWPAVAFSIASFTLERWLKFRVGGVATGVATPGQIEEDPLAAADPLDFELEEGVSTALYRLYSADRELLYVGIAFDPWSRFKQHKRDKDWWQEVVETTAKWYPSRAEAVHAAVVAITLEHPKYNKATWNMEPSLRPELATIGQCGHTVTGKPEDAVVNAYLHERDCLGNTPSQRKLAATFGLHRTKVAALVGGLNGHGQP